MADELITSNHRRFTNIPIRMHEATALLYHFCFGLGVADGRISRPKGPTKAEPRQAARSVCNVLHAVLASGMRVIPQYD